MKCKTNDSLKEKTDKKGIKRFRFKFCLFTSPTDLTKMKNLKVPFWSLLLSFKGL